MGRIRQPFDVTGRPRSLRNPTDANPSHTVTWGFTRKNPAVDAEPSMIQKQLVCFLPTQKLLNFQDLYLVDLHFGGIVGCFHFLVLGGMCFFWKKWGVLVTFPFGELAQWWWKISCTKSFTREKKDGTSKSPIEKDIFGVPAINFPECRYIVK